MEYAIDLSNIYRRLYNLQAKSEHYYTCLRAFLGRMGCRNDIHGTINEKIARREKFAKELGILADYIRCSRSEFPLVKRPVAVHWVVEEKLLNVDCSDKAKKLLHEADVKSCSEYRYLLNIKGVPETVKKLANGHIKVLEEHVL